MVSPRRLATLASFVLALLIALASGLPFAARAGADERAENERRTACQRARRSARVASAQRARSPRARPTRARRTARAARRPRLTPAQRRQIQRWHARPSRAAVGAWASLSPPPLVFRPVRHSDPFTLVPATPEGGFDAEDLALAERALASREGATRAVHPRLVELVYRAVRHFRVPYVHVISGYRDGRATSRHTQGRAIDFVLPGVSDRRLAAFLRPQGFVGVGIYPTSGFVHLDVRSRSHFWSDSSGPDQRSRERSILRSQVARFDAAARRRGEEPVEDPHLGEGADPETETDDEGRAGATPDDDTPTSPGG